MVVVLTYNLSMSEYCLRYATQEVFLMLRLSHGLHQKWQNKTTPCFRGQANNFFFLTRTIVPIEVYKPKSGEQQNNQSESTNIIHMVVLRAFPFESKVIKFASIKYLYSHSLIVSIFLALIFILVYRILVFLGYFNFFAFRTLTLTFFKQFIFLLWRFLENTR